MSFFGFEGNNKDLDEEERKFLADELGGDEKIDTWSTDDYDGLGSALQEGDDELNEETFGGTGPIGKDFDFTAQRLPDINRPANEVASSYASRTQGSITKLEPPRLSQPARSAQSARESVWDDKSPFSVLRTSNSIGRRTGSSTGHQATSSTASIPRAAQVSLPQAHSPALAQSASAQTQPQSYALDGAIDYSAPGVRSLAEVEAEMRLAQQRARDAQAQEQTLLQQQHFQQLQQQQMRPPRMRSYSPSPFPSAASIPQQNYQPSSSMMDASTAIMADMNRQQPYIQKTKAQDVNRNYRTESPRLPLPNTDYVQPTDSMLRSVAEREQALLQTLPGVQRRYDTPEQQAYDRGLLIQVTDELQANILRQMAAEQRRQQQLAAGLLEQMRGSPIGVEHRIRPAMTNEMASRARGDNSPNVLGANPDAAQLQIQQRLLAQVAMQEFNQGIGGMNGQNGHIPQRDTKSNEALRQEAMRKIMEAERQEDKRRRKAAKISHMSRYNDLMTQSDKDFITRIQVSQLVTSDPYTEDFYAQVYGSIMRSNMGVGVGEERVLKFGSGEGVGLGLNQRGGGRRQNAMQRMEAQVERIVNNARQREKDKVLNPGLQGALGKTAGRSHKAAPRQLLQVDTANASDPSTHCHGHISREDAKANAAGAAREAARRGREALGGVPTDAQGVIRRDPLTRRECLMIIERLYDILLQVEQMEREKPSPEDEAAQKEWTQQYKDYVARLWDELRVLVPLETSDPHPLVSLMGLAKGKRLLPRLARHFSHEQALVLSFLIIACFSQFDVVRNAEILDSSEETPVVVDADRQTQLFLATVLQSILPVIAKSNFRLIGGMIGILMERSELHTIARSRPCLLLLTALLSRVEVIKSDMMVGAIEQQDIPSEDDLLFWRDVSEHLVHILAPHLLSLFPSVRMPFLITPQGFSTPRADILDQPVWKFLATLSLQAGNEQQALLVTMLREKILDNVITANKGYITDEAEKNLKMTNINVFLHALGLDSSQILL